jgi:dCTP deaminase
MILSDTQILKSIEEKTIIIEPFDIECLGTNSYDVHLGNYLATYNDDVLDAKKHNQITTFEIPDEGFILMPNVLYLGITLEYTETHATVLFWREVKRR